MNRIYFYKIGQDLMMNLPIRAALIKATESAILAVDAARFFQTERGFQGRFYCALQAELDRAGLLIDGAILEMEYQKSSRHGLRQRPDIIFHIPVEHSGTSVKENNYAVWALKRRATLTDAYDDFYKLDQMFSGLNYPLGFFVNIDATDPMGQYYSGQFGTSLATVATQFVEGGTSLVWAFADVEG